MKKNYSHTLYNGSYKRLTMFDFYKPYRKIALNKIDLAINSYQCLKSRRDIEGIPVTDNTFHTSVLSLIKIFDPKASNLHILPTSKRVPIYRSKTFFTTKREISAFIDFLLYDLKILDRLNNKKPFMTFSISEDYKKLSISIPTIEIEETTSYSVNGEVNFEVKAISIVIDLHLNF